MQTVKQKRKHDLIASLPHFSGKSSGDPVSPLLSGCYGRSAAGRATRGASFWAAGWGLWWRCHKKAVRDGGDTWHLLQAAVASDR